jgi:heme o synthase
MRSTAIAVSRLQPASRSRSTARAYEFVALMKPRVMALAVFTALVGFMIAPGHLDPMRALVAILAIAREPAPPVSSTCGTKPTSMP